jgi:citronellol/citronellal dehydrogenase
MSLLTLGFSREAEFQGIAANTLWPRSLIATDAIRVHFKPMLRHARTPAIMADAAHLILSGLPGCPTGQHFIDEDILRQSGVSDFSGYAVDPSKPLSEDIFLD